MKNYIQCNDTVKASGNERKCIPYEFACRIDEIAETTVIRLGSIDPMTGKALDDPAFFEKYHKIRDFEVKKNLEAIGRALPKKDETKRKALGKELAAQFIKEHGRQPDESELAEMLDRAWPKPSVLHFDSDYIADDKNADLADLMAGKDFPGSEPDDTAMMHELYEKLTPRQKAVYQMMLSKVNNERDQNTWTELAAEWHVSHTQIQRDKDKIYRKIMEFSATVYRFSYDQRA